jgi:DNA polymerase IIIc chi subunit
MKQARFYVILEKSLNEHVCAIIVELSLIEYR